MAIKNTQRGFALLVAVIFTSVMLSFGLALGSLAYKQQVLASSAIESQYAFYAADAGLECALYYDENNNQQGSLFAYQASPGPSSAPLMTCDGTTATLQPAFLPTGFKYYSSPVSGWIVAERLKLYSNTRCADITVYKPASTGTTYIFSTGYDAPCSVIANQTSAARFVSRGIHATY